MVVWGLGIHLPMQEHRFDSWSGWIPHDAEQLSLYATITEACLPGAHAVQQREATVMRSLQTARKSVPTHCK